MINSNVYILGGTISFAQGGCCDVTSDVARASIDVDSNVGNFADAGTPLTAKRNSPVVAVVGSSVFVIGGNDGSQLAALRGIERATIGAGGVLGSFAAVSSQLATPRTVATSVVLGDKIYVLGGHDENGVGLASVEVATVSGNTLGNFTTVPVSLTKARRFPIAAVIGDRLYVMGGQSDQGQLIETVDVATIATDGTLGPFSEVPGFVSNLSTGGSSVLIQNGLIVGSPPQLAPLTP